MAQHSPLSFGVANVAVGLVVLALAWLLGGRPGFGTVANAVLIGLFIDLLASIGWVDGLEESALALRIGLLALGVALFGVGTAFYIGAGLGAGPRDTLMLVGSRRTRQRVGVVRAALELLVLGVGILLGGTFGVGTLVFALAIGPAVELGFAALLRTPLAAPTPARATPIPP